MYVHHVRASRRNKNGCDAGDIAPKYVHEKMLMVLRNIISDLILISSYTGSLYSKYKKSFIHHYENKMKFKKRK